MKARFDRFQHFLFYFPVPLYPPRFPFALPIVHYCLRVATFVVVYKLVRDRVVNCQSLRRHAVFTILLCPVKTAHRHPNEFHIYLHRIDATFAFKALFVINRYTISLRECVPSTWAFSKGPETRARFYPLLVERKCIYLCRMDRAEGCGFGVREWVMVRWIGACR